MLTPVKAMPVGSISPFCEPATTTSTPHSSMRKSIDPRDEITSTRKSAGCLAASIARRKPATSLSTPVEVSLWTTSTAFSACSRSSRSRLSSLAGLTALRQSLGNVSTSSPNASARMPQFSEK